jgi:hypothetical protein
MNNPGNVIWDFALAREIPNNKNRKFRSAEGQLFDEPKHKTRSSQSDKRGIIMFKAKLIEYSSVRSTNSAALPALVTSYLIEGVV